MKDNETINLIEGLKLKLHNIRALEKQYLSLAKREAEEYLELRRVIGKLEACCKAGGSCECS